MGIKRLTKGETMVSVEGPANCIMTVLLCLRWSGWVSYDTMEHPGVGFSCLANDVYLGQSKDVCGFKSEMMKHVLVYICLI